MIQSSSGGWDALTQTINVTPIPSYTLTGWIEDEFGKNTGSFGVRGANGAVLTQTTFGTASTYVPLTVKFNSGANSSITVFAGFTRQLVQRQTGAYKGSVPSDENHHCATEIRGEQRHRNAR